VDRPLDQLAELAGIEPGYWDIFGNWHDAGDDVKRTILSALGFPADGKGAIADSLQRLAYELWGSILAPCVTCRASGQDTPSIPVWLPRAWTDADLVWTVRGEDGTCFEGRQSCADLPELARRQLVGRPLRQARLPLAPELTPGFYRLSVTSPNGTNHADLIAAPAQAYLPPAIAKGGRRWGIATHLYQVRSKADRGVGGFGHLPPLAEAVGRQGADFIGLNPLHALFPQWPAEVSPYYPSSRKFLNPLYLDPTRIAGFSDCAAAQESLAGPELERLRSANMIDYPAAWSALEPVLEALFADFEASDKRRDDFAAFVAGEGNALDRFATFQSIQNDFPDQAWSEWPAPLRHPDSPEVARHGARRAERVRFHQWCQWQAEMQLAAAAQACADNGLGIGLYRDLAVGVAPAGADTWADQDSFVIGARFGAPPDSFNAKGQDWGVPPPDPLALRRDGYRPFIETLRSNMRHAGALRMDHVMALMHLYWIPPGAEADQGAYVRYPMDDLVAIAVTESWRNRCLLVGEDLGTVPDGFRERMDSNGILSYRVLTFERWPDGLYKRPAAYPHLALTTPATHDLPTILGFWRGRDLEIRSDLGLLPHGQDSLKEAEVERTEERRQILGALKDQGLCPAGLDQSGRIDEAQALELVTALHRFLARSPSALLAANLDDVILETGQVNLPGTVDSHPNWRRRQKVAVEDLAAHPGLTLLARAMKLEGR